jgi:hypothetical protein
MKFSKEELFYIIAAFFFGCSLMLFLFQIFQKQHTAPLTTEKVKQHWQVQSIDTMKYSRDLAKQGKDQDGYDLEVNKQVSAIAATGANYIAIDTPYDSEFLPVLKIWVNAARAQGLHVWFRGNFSGWEGWFGYPRISEQDHLQKTQAFILNNKDLFQDGDIFTSCPECESAIKLNLGDPQAIASYRAFLIEEYTINKQSFTAIGKNVASNYFSMNADAARAIMNRQTTQELGGIVVIDHYVRTPEQLAHDVSTIAQQSGGQIVLGEFGAPIPDINGQMTDQQQREWLDQSLKLLSNVNELIGMNYWVNKNGSTAIWNNDGTPKPAVDIITNYYNNSL